MSDNMLYIDKRMASWAEWRARRADSGLGFSKMVSFMYAAPQDANPNATPAGFNQDALDIDKCVVALVEYKREIVMLHYCQGGTNKQKWTAIGISETTYYARIGAAKRDVIGYLQDLYADVPLPIRTDVKKLLDLPRSKTLEFC